MLHEQLKTDMRSAMKARDAVRLRTLRSAVAACTSALVEQKQKPDGVLDDSAVLAVLRRGVKQRKEALMHFQNAGEHERADAERAEQLILEAYLPQMLSEEQVRVEVERIHTETGHTEKGPLMSAVMQQLRGRAEGSVVASAVSDILE